jgi:hypothetical protein
LGRAKFQDGVEAKTVRNQKDGEKAEGKKADTKPEPDHPADQPTPVQNRDGETAKGGK